MTTIQIFCILTALLLLLLSVALWYLWDITRELTRCRADLDKAQGIASESLRRLRSRALDPMVTVPAAVVERVKAWKRKFEMPDTKLDPVNAETKPGIKDLSSQYERLYRRKSRLNSWY